jgi:hypothetical protein
MTYKIRNEQCFLVAGERREKEGGAPMEEKGNLGVD